MRKLIATIGGAAVLAVAAAGPAVAAAGPASCNGHAVSSLAGQPGSVAYVTRLIHDDLKSQGVPPGAGDSSFAKLHEGSVEGCIAAAF